MAAGTADGSVIIKFLGDDKDFNAKIDVMLRKSEAFGNTLNNIGGKISSFGNSMLKLGTAVSAPLLAATKQMIDFDASFQYVLSILSKDVPQTAIDKIRQGVLDLSSSMGIDAVEATRGLYQALSSGVPTDNVLTFMETAAKASKAGMADLFTSVDALSTVVNSYGADVISADKAADLMFQTVKLGKIEFTDLAQNMGQVAALAAQAGVKFEEVSAALAAMTQTGLGPAESFTALRGIIVSILSPSKEAADAAKSLGLEWNLQGLQAKGLSGLLADLQEKTGGQADTIAKVIPEIRAMNGVMVLGAQNGKVYENALKEMSNATGALDESFSRVQESIKATWDKIKATLQRAGIEIGEVLREDITGALDKALAKLNEFTAWAKQNPEEFKELVQSWKNWSIAILEIAVAAKGLGWLLQFSANVVILTAGLTKGYPILQKFFAFFTSASAYNAVMAMGAAIEKIGLAIAGISATTAAGFAAIAAGAGAIAISAYKTKQAQDQFNDTLDKGVKLADIAREKYKLQGNGLDELKSKIESATNAGEKQVAQQMYQQRVLDTLQNQIKVRHEERDALIDGEIKKLGDASNATAIHNTAWLLMAETGMDASQAVGLAAGFVEQSVREHGENAGGEIKKLADKFVDEVAKMDDTARKQLEHETKVTNERAKLSDMSIAKQEEYLTASLTQNQFLNASEETRAEIKRLAATKMITIDQAVLAAKNDYTAAEIELAERGASAEEIATKRKEAARTADKESLTLSVEDIDKFVAEVDQRILDLTAKRDKLREDARSIIQENKSQAFQMLQDAHAVDDEISNLEAQRNNARTAAHNQYVDQKAKEHNIDMTWAQEQMDNAEIEARALEQRKEKLGEHFTAVINALGKEKEVYNALSADQQAVVDTLVANVLESRLAVDSSTEGIKNAYSEATTAATNMTQSLAGQNVNLAATFESTATAQMATSKLWGTTMQENIKVVNTAIQENRAEHDQLVATMGRAQSGLDGMIAGGNASQEEMTRRKEKIADLTIQMQENNNQYQFLTGSISNNRTELIALDEKLNAHIKSLQEAITKTEMQGEDTSALTQELRVMNAEYVIVQERLGQFGLAAGNATQATQAQKEAAQQAAPEISKIGASANVASAGIDGITASTQGLESQTQSSLTTIKNFYIGFMSWLLDTFAPGVADALSYMNPWAEHSPSLVDQTMTGADAIKQIYFDMANGILKQFAMVHADQIALLKNATYTTQRDTQGNVVSVTKTSGPEELSEVFLLKWVQMQDKLVKIFSEQVGEWNAAQIVRELIAGQFLSNNASSQNTAVSSLSDIADAPKQESAKNVVTVALKSSVSPRIEEIRDRLEKRMQEIRDRISEITGGGADRFRLNALTLATPAGTPSLAAMTTSPAYTGGNIGAVLNTRQDVADAVTEGVIEGVRKSGIFARQDQNVNIALDNELLEAKIEKTIVRVESRRRRT